MDPIPATVQRFLHANVESVDQLEILRILASDAQTEFTSRALAKERNLSAEDIERHVRALEARGLLTILAPNPMVCKYGARSPEMDSEIQALVKIYIERPVSVIRMVYEHEKQLRLFAEAFRLKGEE